MTALWTAEAVADATGGTIAGDWVASGVSIDTRSLAPSDLFVALEGPNHDAHAFVAAALEQGAAAAVVSRMPEGVADPANLVLVGDTQAALEGLGRAGRRRTTARIAGITGSVGKTGTKEALRHVLARQAPTHASAASHNNHWGVPLSLARLPEAASYGVLELGMNHAGEIRASHVAGPAARRGDHHGRTRPSRVLCLGGGDRRRQERDLRGPGAGWRRRAQPRQRALCPDARPRRAVAGRADRHLRPPSRRRLAAGRAAPRTRAERGGGRPRQSPLRLSPRHRRASIWPSTAWPCSRSPKRWVPMSPGPQAPWANCGPRPAGASDAGSPFTAARRCCWTRATTPTPPRCARPWPCSVGRPAVASPCSATCWSWAASAGDLHAALSDAVGGGRDRARLHLRPVDGAAARRIAGGTARCPCRATPPPWRRPSSRRCGRATWCWSRARSAAAWRGWWRH